MAYEFTDGTDDTIYGEKRLPQDMDKSVNPEFKIGWSSTVAGSSDRRAYWQLEYTYRAPHEPTSAVAQETLTAVSNASSNVGGLSIATITGMDLPANNDQLLLFRLKRMAANTTDTLNADCVLLGCGMKYTANKLGSTL